MNRSILLMLVLALAACTTETMRTKRQRIAQAHACEELSSCGPDGCRCGATTSTAASEPLPAIATITAISATPCTTCHSVPATGELVDGLPAPPPQQQGLLVLSRPVR